MSELSEALEGSKTFGHNAWQYNFPAILDAARKWDNLTSDENVDWRCAQCGGSGCSAFDGVGEHSGFDCEPCPGPHVMVGDVYADPSKVMWRCWGAVSKGIKTTLHIGVHNDKCGWYSIGDRINPGDTACPTCGGKKMVEVEEGQPEVEFNNYDCPTCLGRAEDHPHRKASEHERRN